MAFKLATSRLAFFTLSTPSTPLVYLLHSQHVELQRRIPEAQVCLSSSSSGPASRPSPFLSYPRNKEAHIAYWECKNVECDMSRYDDGSTRQRRMSQPQQGPVRPPARRLRNLFMGV